MDDQAAQNAINSVLETWVTPAVKRRQACGDLPKPLLLCMAQVILFPDERSPEVRINEEVGAVLRGELEEDHGKSEGDAVVLSDLKRIEDVRLTNHDEPDCAHATLIRFAGGWHLTCDFAYNKHMATEHLAAAREFLAAAIHSVDAGNRRAGLDTLFSAYELIAKASLLRLGDPVFRRKASHRSIKSRFNRWINAPDGAREAFNRLSDLRTRARYLKGDVATDAPQIKEWVGIAHAWILAGEDFLASRQPA